jgi:hypothetical protein
MSDRQRSNLSVNSMVPRWCPHGRESRMLYRVVCKPHGHLKDCISRVRSHFLLDGQTHSLPNRGNPNRILVFNCTHGRSGPTFLETVLAKTAAQLQVHGSEEAPHTFFDKVVFCSNVTYADGHFKGGKIGFSLRLPLGSCATDTCHFPQT